MTLLWIAAAPWGALVGWLFVAAVWRDAAARAHGGGGRVLLRLARPIAAAAAIAAPAALDPIAALVALGAFVIVRNLLVWRKGVARGS